MKKKIVAIISASCLLVGCGSQNLGPLEEKTTKLRDDNHKLKSNIQDLKQNISKEKTNLNSLQKDKDNLSKAKSNKKKVTNLKAASTYYQNIAKALDQYNQIESDVTQNKGNKEIQNKLTDITNKIDTAKTTYSNDIDKEKMSADDKAKNKNISKLNKELNSAMSDIRDGYNAKDQKKIEKGQKSLSSISMTNG
ncbi:MULTISPECIES: hypothetical protein [Staphylococcus]|uniref:hypothetical protein n=1 Tax=Staphylococcus TaxID=1279 RepID=UPI00062BDE99|nr:MULTISPECIES: hypothetical protein [Staphylococcus]MDH9159989.1 hypothetical protein [Staphylococcus succinus]MEB8124655.1 hypothetical protein [Staphylococcus succinus]OIJ29563.1 hypothetical protein BK821_09685 [Staphylococcus sp. LCT-H4]PNZ14483.1 hypothetical protein CD109_13505 [Staphylococcus succinus subsp. succinus]RIN25844.1 hypothetical protein BU067_07565 [Staphylococcus succinus]